MHEEHLTDSRWWKSDEAMVAYAMKEEPMRRHWERNKYLYHPGFVQFIDRKLQELDREKQISLNVSDQSST